MQNEIFNVRDAKTKRTILIALLCSNFLFDSEATSSTVGRKVLDAESQARKKQAQIKWAYENLSPPVDPSYVREELHRLHEDLRKQDRRAAVEQLLNNHSSDADVTKSQAYEPRVKLEDQKPSGGRARSGVQGALYRLRHRSWLRSKGEDASK